jgi:hypothetical protein
MAGIHVIYGAQTKDLTFDQLFPADQRQVLGIPEATVLTSSNVTEDQVKRALASYFDVGVGEFEDHAVELNPNGNITVRPDTPFGT